MLISFHCIFILNSQNSTQMQSIQRYIGSLGLTHNTSIFFSLLKTLKLVRVQKRLFRNLDRLQQACQTGGPFACFVRPE